MNRKNEKLALFWCELLNPVIFGDIEPEGTNKFLKHLSQKEVMFPNGEIRKPSLSTMRRKLNRFKKGGFNALFRKIRGDKGTPRKTRSEVAAKAIALKKDQAYRSDRTINRFLEDEFGVTMPRSTLYRHLKQAGATRLKLGVSKQKVRKRIVKDHTHDLWVGDFEEGPYVIVGDEILPTYLAGIIDHYSRYIVGARYYLKQNLDILIDLLIRALAVYGSPHSLYLDNAKVFHATGLKTACYKMHTRLIHRTAGDPAPGGAIERFFLTVQTQFEAEVRAGDTPTLDKLNKAFCAWLNVAYHEDIHTDIGRKPIQQYKKGLKAIRQVETSEIIAAFMRRVTRTVNRTFSDVQLDNRLYKVDPKLRGDKVEVRFDPFSKINTVEIRSINGEYLCTGQKYNRQCEQPPAPIKKPGKTQYDYIDLLVRQHEQKLHSQTKGIDYRKVVKSQKWPFAEFAKSFADLLGRKGGLTSFTAGELEKLKKTYNQCVSINKSMLKTAFENAQYKTVPYVIHELKLIIKNKEDN